jgi:hypothetical protein
MFGTWTFVADRSIVVFMAVSWWFGFVVVAWWFRGNLFPRRGRAGAFEKLKDQHGVNSHRIRILID